MEDENLNKFLKRGAIFCLLLFLIHWAMGNGSKTQNNNQPETVEVKP